MKERIFEERSIRNPKSIFSSEQWRSSTITPRSELLIRPGVEIQAEKILTAGKQKVNLIREEKNTILVGQMRATEKQNPVIEEQKIAIFEQTRWQDDGGG